MAAQWVRIKIQRAEVEIAVGRLWRAKEMLRGCMASGSYALEPDLLEAYGRLLDKLGDRYEAGKYLLLSGKEHPEYEEAISIYLDRNKRRTASELLSQFPATIRRYGLGHLPGNVRQILEEKGASTADLERRGPLPYGVREVEWKERVAIVAFAGTLFCAAVLCIVGLVTVIRWVLQLSTVRP